MRTDGVNNWVEVLPPIIMLPLQDAAVSALLGFTITLAPIVRSTAGAHASTDYEARTAPLGAGGVAWSTNSTADLQATIVPIGATSGLAAGQTYYIRARFNSDDGSRSAWSSDRRVTT